MPKIVDRTLAGREAKTPLLMQFGVFGIVALVVIVVLAIAFPLYFALGGK